MHQVRIARSPRRLERRTELPPLDARAGMTPARGIDELLERIELLLGVAR